MYESRKHLSEYFQTQLEYDHKEDPHPPNTQAVIQNQHRMIREAVRCEARRLPVRFLDVGCGWGDFSTQLDMDLADYVGVEPSLKELRRFARKPMHYRVRGIGENLDFLRTSSRSIILLNSVLDHCIDWRRTFTNCKRVLCPGGILIVSMENQDKLPTRLRKLFRRKIVHEGHVTFFSFSEFQEFLREEGLEIEQSVSMGFLHGMHHVTKLVPLPVCLLRSVNRVMDAWARRILPTRGHIMFFVARKPFSEFDQAILARPFQCMECSRPIDFGMSQCPQCGSRLGYLEKDILNALPEENLLE